MSAARAEFVERQFIDAQFTSSNHFYKVELAVNEARSLFYALRDALREAGVDTEQ